MKKTLFEVEEIINGFNVTWTNPLGKTTTEFVETEPAAFVLFFEKLGEYSANKIRPAIICRFNVLKLQQHRSFNKWFRVSGDAKLPDVWPSGNCGPDCNCQEFPSGGK